MSPRRGPPLAGDALSWNSMTRSWPVRLQNATAHSEDWLGSGAEPGHAGRASWGPWDRAGTLVPARARIDKTAETNCRLIFNSLPPHCGCLDFHVKRLE